MFWLNFFTILSISGGLTHRLEISDKLSFHQRSYFEEDVIDDAIATFSTEIKPILGHDHGIHNKLNVLAGKIPILTGQELVNDERFFMSVTPLKGHQLGQ